MWLGRRWDPQIINSPRFWCIVVVVTQWILIPNILGPRESLKGQFVSYNNKQNWQEARERCSMSGKALRLNNAMLAGQNKKNLLLARDVNYADSGRRNVCVCLIGNSGATSNTLYRTRTVWSSIEWLIWNLCQRERNKTKLAEHEQKKKALDKELLGRRKPDDAYITQNGFTHKSIAIPMLLN